MQSLESRVKTIVAKQLSVNESEIHENSSFIDDLGADSLDNVELVMEIEEEFNVEIPDQDAAKIATFGDVIRYIKANGKQAA